LKQNLAQLVGLGIAGGETLSVNLTQRADQGVPMFMADLAILIAVAIVEAGLALALPLSSPRPTTWSLYMTRWCLAYGQDG